MFALVATGGCGRGRVGTSAGASGRVPAVVPKVPVESPVTAAAGQDAFDGSADGVLPAQGPMVVLNIAGVRQRMKEATGQVLLVHVWASWCAPCLQELPQFDRVAARAQRRGAQVLTLAVDTEYRDIARVQTVLRERAPHLTPLVADYGPGMEFFRLFSKDWRGSIPATFVFGRDGKLQTAFTNFADPKRVNIAVDEALSERSP